MSEEDEQILQTQNRPQETNKIDVKGSQLKDTARQLQRKSSNTDLDPQGANDFTKGASTLSMPQHNRRTSKEQIPYKHLSHQIHLKKSRIY